MFGFEQKEKYFGAQEVDLKGKENFSQDRKETFMRDNSEMCCTTLRGKDLKDI